MSIETILLYIAILLIFSIVASRLANKFAIPALLLFLFVGMLIGPEGPGRISFNHPWLAKSIGIVALIFIMFSGGIDTHWKEVKPILIPGIVLSTLGVLLTAVFLGYVAVFVLKFTLLEGFLLGAIVSSTDAAAVFSVLRSKHVNLKGVLRPLLEFESGSNDPMAVFLTIGLLGIITHQHASLVHLLPLFLLDMGMGAIVGYGMARLTIFIINNLKLEYSGLYPVLTMALLLLTYAVSMILKGNGFLAVYLVGIMLANHEFLHKKTIIHFHEGLAWLMQIVMFLTLGLLVFPSQIVPIAWIGVLVAVGLVFIARPLSVLVCLLPFKMSLNKKVMVSWVGLRGAVPIILATFPLLAGIGHANVIFNIVFFVVVTSVLIQGTSIPLVAKLLKVDTPFSRRKHYPLEFEKTEGIDAGLNDVIVPYNSGAVGKTIIELKVPRTCLIVLVSRGDKFIIPNGSTVIEGGDVLLVLASERDLKNFQSLIAYLKENR